MSLELLEATLKEQAEALETAQRCHGHMARLIKEYKRHRNADHQDTSQHKGQSKMHKQDTTPLGRLYHEVVAGHEDASDDDLIQGSQEYERKRRQTQHSASSRLLQALFTDQPYVAQLNFTDLVSHQHCNAATQDKEVFPVLPVAGLRAFHFCTAKHPDGSNKCLR